TGRPARNSSAQREFAPPSARSASLAQRSASRSTWSCVAESCAASAKFRQSKANSWYFRAASIRGLLSGRLPVRPLKIANALSEGPFHQSDSDLRQKQRDRQLVRLRQQLPFLPSDAGVLPPPLGLGVRGLHHDGRYA